MAIDDYSVHPKFKLNGFSYSNSELKEIGYDLIKEGSIFEKAVGDFLSDWLDKASLLKVKTSGSTGKPKSILLQKQHMINSARATGEYFDLKAEDSALLCLSADYIAGKMMLVRAMVLGLELDFVDTSSSPLTGVYKTYDFAAMVPMQLQNSVKEIDQIKTLIVGGAAMSSSLKQQVQNKKTAVFETYGMTETITHVAVKRTNPPLETSRSQFQALPNVFFQADDRDCLIIDALSVSNETIITNDIVNLISDSEFEWLGRYDNVINSGGVKLYPEKIEAKLEKYVLSRFFVAGFPDEKLGKKLVLVVEGEIDSNELHDKIKKSTDLERFEIPKNIYSLYKFLETDTGKIQRSETMKLLKS